MRESRPSPSGARDFYILNGTFGHRGCAEWPVLMRPGAAAWRGPVVAAAVVLSPDCVIARVDDSKKLSRTQREVLYEEIAAKALSVGIGQVEAAEIDRLNILQASLKAMRLALENLRTPARPGADRRAPAGAQPLSRASHH